MTAVIPVMDLNQREKLYFTPGLWRIICLASSIRRGIEPLMKVCSQYMVEVKREIVAVDPDLG